MGGNSIGTIFTVTSFGESHGPAIGGVVDGVPPGIPFDSTSVQRELDRRRPGQSPMTTARVENDQVEILSGVMEGATTGTPIGMLIRNRDADSSAYEALKDRFRPGHADLAYLRKYGTRDHRGGGRSSGRETAARVAAGAVAKAVLSREGIVVTAYTVRAAGIPCVARDLSSVEGNPLRACDPAAAARMSDRIGELAAAGDSAGGIVECLVRNLPAGLGDPVFDKLEARIGAAVLSIGGIRGVEFGDGFACADRRGSENNDQMDESGYLSNHAGGIAGGISTGQEIVFRAAVKPTPSIAVPQRTIDVEGNPRTLSVSGRHDPCLCPRIVPVVEAMTAIVIVDALLIQRSLRGSFTG